MPRSPYQLSLKGNTVQVNIARIITTGACALVLALTLLQVAVQAQPAATAATQTAPSAAPAALPVINDVKPGDASAAKKAESTDNPYGLESLWKSSDMVARTVLLLLLIMSVGSWYILIVKVFEQAKMSRQAKAVVKDFWPAGTVQQGADACLLYTSP